MKLETFVNKWNGKFCEFNNDQFKFQCVDLMRQWQTEGLETPASSIPGALYAKDIFLNFKDNKYFKKVLNTPNNMPKKGDIIFFKTSYWFPFLYGIAGHVGIVSDASLYRFISFDQNFPTGSPCKYVNHTYKDVLGWLSRV